MSGKSNVVGRLIGGTSGATGMQTLGGSHQSAMSNVTFPLSKYSEGGVSPALNLDFKEGQYRLGKTGSTFTEAFTGNSPKLTYSTTSNSTMVNSAGEIVWAPHNLIRHSEDFTDASWVKASGATVGANTTSSPDGTQNADTVTCPNTSDTTPDVYVSSIAVSSGSNYTFSVWLRSDTPGKWPLNVYDGSSHNVLVVDVTDTWERFTITMTAASASINVYLCDKRSGVSGSNTYLNSVYIWGAHVYRSDLGGMHPVPGAATGFEYYVPTNGNPEYLPRVGHHVYNGSAWVNEGLLIESEARTNLFPTSTITAVGSGTDWDGNNSGTGSSVSVAAGVTSPDGTTGAVGNFVADASATIAYFAKDVPVTYNVTYTQSVYAKPNGMNFLQIAPSTGFASAHYNFDLVNLETSSSDASIEDAGNGWVRCSVTATCTSTTSIGRMVFAWINSFTAPRLDSDAGGAPNGTDGVYLYGAQLEAAPTPSSYMPTSGGTYTRTAQSLEVPPAQFGWNSEAVSIQMDGRMTYADEDNFGEVRFMQWDTGGDDLQRLDLDTNGADTGQYRAVQATAAGSPSVLSSATTYSPGINVPFNISSRHGSTFVNGAVDGVALTADTTPTALPDLSGTNLQIAQDFMGTIGTFRQFAGDIGDTGLVTATNPSTEPTLSLTFNGTGGSYYNLSWSE